MPSEQDQARVSAGRPLRLVAAGDLIFGDTPLCAGFGVGSRYPGSSAAETLSRVRGRFLAGDLGFANLEGVLLPRSGSEAGVMRAEPEIANVLKDAGITLVNVANNHSMEHGASAFEFTVERLRATGLRVVGVAGRDGWACEPVRVRPEGSGLEIGVLGYSCRPPQFEGDRDPAHAAASEREILADVRRLARETDVVIISLHWGEDHVNRPSEDEAGFARRLLDAGAVVVLGHHPQVVRPVQWLGGQLVAFSLGSLVADHTWLPRTRRGLILECDIDRSGVTEARSISTRLDRDFRAKSEQGPATTVVRQTAPVLDAKDYLRAARRAGRTRRMRGGLHALRNFHRYDPSVRRGIALKFLRNRPTASPLSSSSAREAALARGGNR